MKAGEVGELERSGSCYSYEDWGSCEGWGVREAVKSGKVSGCLGDSGRSL